MVICLPYGIVSCYKAVDMGTARVRRLGMGGQTAGRSQQVNAIILSLTPACNSNAILEEPPSPSSVLSYIVRHTNLLETTMYLLPTGKTYYKGKLPAN